MDVEQFHWRKSEGWQNGAKPLRNDAQLVLVFGGGSELQDSSALKELRDRFPEALLFGCSTAGEICGTSVHDESIVATAVHFDRTSLQSAGVSIPSPAESFAVGRELAQSIAHDGLRHAFVLSDGLGINGSDLVRGLKSALPENVTVTGGLSGDGARFGTTYVLLNDRPQSGIVTILGFYGKGLSVGYGSLGGWDPFGPERLITKSAGNVLYELDGQSALKLYKRYLGEHAHGLPATGLLFPLSLRTGEDETPVVRTILMVNEAEQSMTFAGDVPEGAYARLMKANFDRLVDGAMSAARTSQTAIGEAEAQLAILISCVGRKLVLKQRIEEEVEGVQSVLGPIPVLAGFYSYGEISPFTPSARCELHNQTMTITTLAEAA
jgi:hypothetical protein